MLSARTAAAQLFVIVYNCGFHGGIPAYAPIVLLSAASASGTHKVARGSPAVTPHRARFRQFRHADENLASASFHLFSKSNQNDAGIAFEARDYA